MTIAYRSHTVQNNSGSGTITINKPSGVVNNDLLIAFFSEDSDTPRITATGWTAFSGTGIGTNGTVVVGTTRDPRYAPLYSVVTTVSGVTSYTDERDAASLARLSYGIATQAMADANQTITQAQALCDTLITTGALTATRNLVVPLVRRRWIVRNNCTGGSVQVIGASGTGVTIATAKVAIVECDGTNVLRVTADA